MYTTFTAVECQALAPILNGAITYGPDTIAPYDVGTVATHTCDDGSIFVAGSLNRTCLTGGRWSGFTPLCRRICKANYCEPRATTSF